MTSADMTLLSTDEVCRLLGIEPRRLKQLIRDRALIEARGRDGERGIPREVVVKGENGWEPLPALQGTLTLLADDGFTPEESLAWLYAAYKAGVSLSLSSLSGTEFDVGRFLIDLLVNAPVVLMEILGLRLVLEIAAKAGGPAGGRQG